jgi:hypothetical protein
MVAAMNLTETPAGRTVAWSRELPQLLAVCGPLGAISAAALLRAAGHVVTAAEVEQELACRPDVHETDDGWVSVLAIAEGSVLTTQLTPQACQTGVVVAGGDLDLWARLAAIRGMPLRSGGALRTVWPAPPDAVPPAAVPPDAVPPDAPGLAGPDGWLSEFEPGRIIGLRLRDGALELIPADDLLDGERHGQKFGQRLTALVEVGLPLCELALTGFADAADAGQVGDLLPVVPLEEVALELMWGRPGILSEPLPPLSVLLPVLGFEVSQGHVGLPGTFWHPADVAGLRPYEITASVSGSALLRSKFHGGEPGEWQRDFWTVMALGPGVVGRVADVAKRSGVEPKVLAELRESASTTEQRAIAALLAARAVAAEVDSVRSR